MIDKSYSIEYCHNSSALSHQLKNSLQFNLFEIIVFAYLYFSCKNFYDLIKFLTLTKIN